MDNEQLTQAVVSLTEAVELLQKQMRGIREENRVLLEDRWPAKVGIHPGLVPMSKIQPGQFDYRIGERGYYTEKTDGNFYTQGERA